MSPGWHGRHEQLIGPSPEWLARAERIQAMRDEGRTWASIAAEFGVSKQRAHQMGTRAPDGRNYALAHVRRGVAP